MPITPRQLESIIRLAEAEAKMYLSESVDVKHADRAIDLMNLFLSVTLGGDVDFAFFGADAAQRKKDTDPRMRVLSIIDEQGKENQSFDKAISYKIKKKIKNRETAIGRRIKTIETEIDKARALVQNKKNQDNYQILLKIRYLVFNL